MKDNEFGSIEQAIQDIREGKMIICTDDPDRENEGDLICAAEKTTPEIINFMATYGKGLICMPMGEKVIDKLGLSQMVDKNTDNHETAFTVSIDHVDTTTGISAHERAKTAVECTRDDAQPSEFRRPGHMFPLKAKAKGVFERRGHTEATVDLCRLAGLKECGICCEIMKDDGHMMRKTELLEMAKKHKLTFITIKDLIEYRKKNDIFMERVCAADFPTRYGQFKIYGYVNKINGEHHIAMVKGSVDDGKPVLVRVHSECLTGDALGSARCDCGDQYDAAMKEIASQPGFHRRARDAGARGSAAPQALPRHGAARPRAGGAGRGACRRGDEMPFGSATCLPRGIEYAGSSLGSHTLSTTSAGPEASFSVISTQKAVKPPV